MSATTPSSTARAPTPPSWLAFIIGVAITVYRVYAALNEPSACPDDAADHRPHGGRTMTFKRNAFFERATEPEPEPLPFATCVAACEMLKRDGVPPLLTVLVAAEGDVPVRLVELYHLHAPHPGFADDPELVAALDRGEAAIASERVYLIGLVSPAEGKVVRLVPDPPMAIETVHRITGERTVYRFRVPIHPQP